MEPVASRPPKGTPGPRTNPAQNLIDALAAVAFDDLPEPAVATSDEVESLLDDLMLGVLDDHLEQIAAIVKIRQDMIAGVTELVARSRFHQGDRVRFIDSAKPRYLAGHSGVISKMEMERCVVQLDDPIGRYTDGVVKARATQLEPISPE
jgi:hypothetical protein